MSVVTSSITSALRIDEVLTYVRSNRGRKFEMRSVLTDGTITIRPVSVDDTDAMFEAALASRSEVYPWLPWCHPEYTREESRTWLALAEENWANSVEYPFSIVDAGSDRYLGGVGINMVRHANNFANLGYWVRSDATRRGVATAATLLAARFGFEELGLNRIEILASVENIASQRVAEGAGALREGILRRRLILHGRAHDVVLYSLVREDILHE
jgi:RimJ/RimL family protein N-acetyltransferase